MDVMQLRRGLMMGMANVKTIPNLIKNLTILPGFFGTDGSISNQTGNKELYTQEYIDVSAFGDQAYLVFFQKNNNSNSFSPWFGIGQYDENENWISRQVNNSIAYNPVVDNIYSLFGYARLVTGTKKIRISWRSYDTTEIFFAMAGTFNENLDFR